MRIPILPCVSSTLRGPKGCAKGTLSLCNFVHPKLCRASLVSGKCDRNRCYFYHVTGPARSNHMNVTSNPQNKMHGSNYHPTPLMQVSVPPPHVPKPVSNAPQTNTASPPAQTPISDPQPVHTTSFLEELKEIRSQMLQMQQTQNLLMQNMLTQMWPPFALPKTSSPPKPNVLNNSPIKPTPLYHFMFMNIARLILKFLADLCNSITISLYKASKKQVICYILDRAIQDHPVLSGVPFWALSCS